MKFKVFYNKNTNAIRDFHFIEDGEMVKKVAESVLNEDYVPIAVIEAKDDEAVFFNMQGEVWSPNGEAKELVNALGLKHTSMMVGDYCVDEEGIMHVVQSCGFCLMKENTFEAI